MQPQWAAWTSLNGGRVSFTRDWTGRSMPDIWWGEDRLPVSNLRRVPVIEFAYHSGYCKQRGRFIFFIKADRTESFNVQSGLYLAADFNGWATAVGNDRWRLLPMQLGKVAGYGLSVKESEIPADRHSYFKWVTGNGEWLPVPEDAPNIKIDERGIRNYRISPARTGRHLLQFTLPLSLSKSEGRQLYVAIDDQVHTVALRPGVFLKGLGSEAPLGARVIDGSTRFALFAPRAAAVELFVFDDAAGPEGDPLPMIADSDGVWRTVIDDDLHGKYYHYSVIGQDVDEIGHFDANVRIPDPYALAMAGPRGPGIVVAPTYFKRAKAPFTPPSWHDLVILEAHVRDLNALAPIEVSETERRGFKGLTAFARHKNFYPSDLGVNAIELQPIQIFDTMDPTEYAWGYMPMNYFAPATQYADPRDPLSAIADCREMIDTLHGRGLAVLLDVVYNHIGEPNFFQYIDKEYYFLLDEKGNYENHSGCGNTFDADTPMFRRLMRDSLLHWIEAYDVDGFRFDLGELIGVEAFRWLEGELKRAKPGIILIAEPWSFRGHIASQLRDTGFASWNDGFREYLRRYLTLQTDAASMPFFVGGSAPDLSSFPAQTVNYVASHDDRCWIDKITQNPGHDGHVPTSIDRRRTHLMIATLMSCLGIPMLASGVDAMKSKGGVNNTYLRGELNAIPYSRQSEYSGTVDYFRRWIAFRRSHHGRLLRLHRSPTDRYFRFFMEGHACAWLVNADYSQGRDQLLFVVNPSYGFIDVRMEALHGIKLQQLCDTERWGDPYLGHPCFPQVGEVIKVPPMSCGLFLSML